MAYQNPFADMMKSFSEYKAPNFSALQSFDVSKAVDRSLLLQSSPLLARATATQIWRLSSIAREMTVAQGAEAFAKGSEAAILIVLSGSLRVEGEDQAGTATAGDVIGMYETLAGSPIHAKVTANKESNVLRIDRGDNNDSNWTGERHGI